MAFGFGTRGYKDEDSKQGKPVKMKPSKKEPVKMKLKKNSSKKPVKKK